MPEETSDLRNELEQLLQEVEGKASPGTESQNEEVLSTSVEGIGHESPSNEIETGAELLAQVEREVMEDPDNNLDSEEGGPIMGKGNDIPREGTLSLDLTGEVSIDLKLNFGSQTIYLSCDNENLLVQLGDGTQFRLPFGTGQAEAA